MSSPSVSADPCSREIAPITTMLDHLDRGALVELERVLASTLRPGSTPAQRRKDELGFLASLLVDGGSGRDASAEIARPAAEERISKTFYEARRPASSPSGAALTQRYGSWRKACRAAAALARSAAGRRSTRPAHGQSQPWQSGAPGRASPPAYTREEVLEAVRLCARKLDRDTSQLTSNVYYAWVAEKRRRAKESGAPAPRLPTQRSVERFFENWPSLIVFLAGNFADRTVPMRCR